MHLEFELAYYNITAQHMSYFIIETPNSFVKVSFIDRILLVNNIKVSEIHIHISKIGQYDNENLTLLNNHFPSFFSIEKRKKIYQKVKKEVIFFITFLVGPHIFQNPLTLS